MKMMDAYSGFAIDFSRMNIDMAQVEALQDKFAAAASEMAALEAGAIKNPDEKRKVTHFTDRISYRNSELFKEVEAFAEAIQMAVQEDHFANIHSQGKGRCKDRR